MAYLLAHISLGCPALLLFRPTAFYRDSCASVNQVEGRLYVRGEPWRKELLTKILNPTTVTMLLSSSYCNFPNLFVS